MAREIDQTRFTREDRQRYRDKVKRDLAVLRRLLDDGWLAVDGDQLGMEVEFHLVDAEGVPAMVNAGLLGRITASVGTFQTELAQFNVEANLAPHPVTGRVLADVRRELETSLTELKRGAADLDVEVAMIGTLPTVDVDDISVSNLSADPRYHQLNEQILGARGEDLHLTIAGRDRLELTTNSIAVEAAATSVQLHLDTHPDRFPRTWNAAQALAAVQVAIGANSPVLFGRELHHETRIALFEQTIDTRTEELAAQGVRPRVWFGERWIAAATDLFEENIRYFPSLLPVVDEEDPEAEVAAGRVPSLPELALHNGTVWRWNRPVYAVTDGRPALRLENRVLPAGPTTIDTVANAALFVGLVRALVDRDEPIEARLPFATAAANFRAAARDGIGAVLDWPGLGALPAHRLVAEVLLPVAEEGLATDGVERADRDRYLEVIAGRCEARANGASWQPATHRALRETQDRAGAARELLAAYLAAARTGDPVHTWGLTRR